MFHIDHARSAQDGKTQPGYLFNRMLFEEITTLLGVSLTRYLTRQRAIPWGDPDKYEKAVRTEKG